MFNEIDMQAFISELNSHWEAYTFNLVFQLN